MARERTGGFVKKNGKLYTRVRWTGADGKRHAVWREVENRTHGREVKKELIREYDERGPESVLTSRKTFNELADYFAKIYLVEAVYRDGQKVAGRRSLDGVAAQVKVLRDYFGKSILRTISYGDLEAFKAKRLATPKLRRLKATKTPKPASTRASTKKPAKVAKVDDRKDLGPRALASVHRELALLRRMLNVALRENWILKNPFSSGEPLINVSQERRRERILTLDEEAKLLAACTGKREHLHAIITAALDTVMRQGQLFDLRWRDVDFVARSISTVTHKGRRAAVGVEVTMTSRLFSALLKLHASQPNAPSDRVFGITSNVKRSFEAACKEAGIEHGGIDGLTFHCLRHTAITRMVAGGISLSEAGRLAGHSQPSTTYRYAHATRETQQRAVEIFEALHKEAEEAEAKERVN